jgi:formylglycine-generating enzyme required for sulfatase activity
VTSKFALVIANTEYEDASFAKLTAPGKDAEEFAQVLRDAELAAFDDVQVLINEGEGKTRRSIARFFAERKPADLLLLYFSGHGVRNEQGQLFLAANDTEISILEATGIPAEFITRAMNTSRSQRQLLILDCCNSGAFAHGSKSASGVGKSMGIASAFEGDGYGRVVLTATDATQFAWEGDKVIGDTQKSVFTHFLIEGLKGEADRDSDGRIHVDELYDYAYEQVVRRTPKQTPGKWSYKQQGDMILRENLKPRDVKPSPLPADLLELLSHPNSGVRKVGIQDLISLLDGKHLGLSRAAQEKLREIAETDDSLTLRKTAGDTLIAHGIIWEQPIEIQKESPSVSKPSPVEMPKEERREEKQARKVSRSMGESRQSVKSIEAGREKTPYTLPDWRSIVKKFDLRVLGVVIGISLLIVLGIRFIPGMGNLFAPKIGSTMTSDKDGMTLLYVPAGEFTMGSDNGGPEATEEKPAHKVYLDAFWIDQTEVTNEKYALCVNAGQCESPRDTDHFSNNDYGNHPVAYVSWHDASAYCAWAGRRLPTEAEWEKAARGPDGQIYPWGNEPPDSDLLNFNNEIGETAEAGNYPNGVSPYGAMDMAGNVWEWVADWYDENYYATLGERPSNPQGPASGQYRVLRGGSWNYSDDSVRSAFRNWLDPKDTSYYVVGFRCAMSATP